MPLSMPQGGLGGAMATPGPSVSYTPVPFSLAGGAERGSALGGAPGASLTGATPSAATPAGGASVASVPAPRKQGSRSRHPDPSEAANGETLASRAPGIPSTASTPMLLPSTTPSGVPRSAPEKRRRSHIPVFVGAKTSGVKLPRTPNTEVIGDEEEGEEEPELETVIEAAKGDSDFVTSGNDTVSATENSPVFSLLEHGYASLCQFKCADALAYFALLPDSQRLTGWVQHQVSLRRTSVLSCARLADTARCCAFFFFHVLRGVVLVCRWDGLIWRCCNTRLQSRPLPLCGRWTLSAVRASNFTVREIVV